MRLCDKTMTKINLTRLTQLLYMVQYLFRVEFFFSYIDNYNDYPKTVKCMSNILLLMVQYVQVDLYYQEGPEMRRNKPIV